MKVGLRFSIRDILLVMVIVALSVGWWFDRQRLTEEISQIKPLLQPASTIEGQVTYADSGMPATGIRIIAQATNGYIVGRATGGRATTDNTGHYKLVNLAPANWNILVDADGWTAVAIDSLPLIAGEQIKNADLQLTKGSLIKGRVIDDDTRKPIDWAGQRIQIGVYGPARPRTGAAVNGVLVDNKGEFQIHVPAGRNFPYVMSVLPSWVFDGKEYQLNGILVEDGEPAEIEFSIKMPPASGQGSAPQTVE